MDTGADHRALTTDQPVRSKDTAQAAVPDREALRGDAAKHGTLSKAMCNYCGDIGPGIRAMRACLDECAKGVAPVQRRFPLTHIL